MEFVVVILCAVYSHLTGLTQCYRRCVMRFLRPPVSYKSLVSNFSYPYDDLVHCKLLRGWVQPPVKSFNSSRIRHTPCSHKVLCSFLKKRNFKWSRDKKSACFALKITGGYTACPGAERGLPKNVSRGYSRNI